MLGDQLSQQRGPGGSPPPPPSPAPHLFLDQTEARRAEKNIWRPPPPPLSQGLDNRPPTTPYLKVWIRHCFVYNTS